MPALPEMPQEDQRGKVRAQRRAVQCVLYQGDEIPVKARLIVQVRLRSPNKDGSVSERTCFVDNARIRKGSKITLSNSEDRRRRREVMWVSESMDAALIHADWNVGGLS